MLGIEARNVRAAELKVGDKTVDMSNVVSIEVNGDGSWFDMWLPEGHLRVVTVLGTFDIAPHEYVECFLDTNDRR